MFGNAKLAAKTRFTFFAGTGCKHRAPENYVMRVHAESKAQKLYSSTPFCYMKIFFFRFEEEKQDLFLQMH